MGFTLKIDVIISCDFQGNFKRGSQKSQPAPLSDTNRSIYYWVNIMRFASMTRPSAIRAYMYIPDG